MNKNKNFIFIYQKKKGFTLIELLVVIAIIGILATIVIFSISSAQNKNADAAVKQALSSVPAQAELFHSDNGSNYVVNGTVYVCSPSEAKSIYPILENAARNAGTVAININSAGSLNAATCNNSDKAWAVEVPLKIKDIGGTGKSAMFCVDSIGFVGTRSQSMGTSVSCPSS